MYILNFGEILWDNFPQSKKIGGSSYNTAAHLAKLGAGKGSCLLSSVGKDEDGDKAVQEAARTGIDIQGIARQEKMKTGQVMIHTHDNGEPEFEISASAAWDNISGTLPGSWKGRIWNFLVINTLSLRKRNNRAVLKGLLKTEKFQNIYADLNFRENWYNKELVMEILSLCGYLKINNSEARELRTMTKETDLDSLYKKLICDFGIHTVLHTMGARGARIIQKKNTVQIPAFRTNIMDTVGAGDAFNAGFIYGIASGFSPEKSLKVAVRLSSFVAGQAGAVPEYNREIIEKAGFLQ